MRQINSRERLLGNGGWLLGDRLLRMVLGFWVGTLVAKHLGPTLFGQFNYVISIFLIFSALAGLGLDGYLVKIFVDRRSARDQIIGTLLTLKVCAGVFSICLMLMLGVFLELSNTLFYMLFFISSGLVFQSFDVLDLWFQSELKSKYVVISRGLAFIGGLIFKLALIHASAPLHWFVIASLFEIAFASLMLVWVYRTKVGHFPTLRFDSLLVKEVLLHSWPLLLTTFLVMGYSRLDVLFLKEFYGDHDVGIYSAAVRLSEIFYFIPAIITTTIAPELIVLKKSDPIRYEYFFRKILSFLTFTAVLIGLLVSAFSTLSVSKVYGQEFLMSAEILRVHIWTCVFVFLGVASSQYLIIEGLQKLTLFRTLVAFSICLILNALLVPTFGPVCSAYVTLISYAVAVFSLGVFPATRMHVRHLLSSINFWTILGGRSNGVKL